MNATYIVVRSTAIEISNVDLQGRSGRGNNEQFLYGLWIVTILDSTNSRISSKKNTPIQTTAIEVTELGVYACACVRVIEGSLRCFECD